jgi:hypothetical protein
VHLGTFCDTSGVIELHFKFALFLYIQHYLSKKKVHKVLPSKRLIVIEGNNSIEHLVINGLVCLVLSVTRDHIVQFYDSIFIERFSWRPSLDGLSLDTTEGRRPIGWRNPLRMMRSSRW